MEERPLTDTPRLYQTEGGRSRRKRRVLRAVLITLLTLLIIVGAVAGGSYWWFTARLHAANAKLDQAAQDALAAKPPTTLVGLAEAPDSMNLILLGNDTRDPTGDSLGASDVIMLVHIDPSQDYMSILSITRDLYVPIPGQRTDRINMAYHIGGPALTIATIKQVFGVDVTKYMEVNFESFASIIDSLGGVYVDVDRHYNKTPTWAIDIDPGYQLLDGPTALLFARYRFDGNSDFGRMQRQQRIMGALRDQVKGWNITFKLPGLVEKVLSASATNLSANETLKLARWMIGLDGGRIKQIMIKSTGTMIDGKAVVVVDQQTIMDAVTQLLTPPGTSGTTTTGGPSTTGTPTTGASTDGGVSTVGDAAAGGDAAATTPSLLQLASTNTSNLLSSGALTAAQTDPNTWRAAQKNVPFTLEAPSYLPEGFTYSSKMPTGSGTYGIKVGDGTEPAVRMIYRQGKDDLYLGISATTWLDAPLASGGTEVKSNGVTYTIVGSSGKVDHVWWVKDGVLFWVTNTLFGDLDREQLLAVAMSTVPVTP